MNGYDLTRNWYNLKFENSSIRHIHSDMFFYIVDLWNRLGNKPEFGLPTSVTMETLNIGSYNTYKKTLDDLIGFGVIILVRDSKNQHQSKIIALSNYDKATDKALDKATIKALDKATDKATDTIVEQVNNRPNKQITIELKQLENKFSKEREKLELKIEELKAQLALKDKKPKKEKDSAEKEKRPHGEHQNVFLLDAEVDTLIKNNGMEVCNMAVDKLSNYKLASGKRYKSDYGAINQWVLESVQKSINERKIQGNIIKKTEQNEQQNRKGETSGDYLKRVGSGLDEIFNLRFGRAGNQPADATEDASPNYSEFAIVV